jgi:osmotically-inducible protein OsmY
MTPRRTLPPGNNPAANSDTTATGVTTTNSVATNPTNQFSSTNQFAMTNDNDADDTNRFGRNDGSNGFHGDFRFRDQALTASDRVLLRTLVDGIEAQLGSTSSGRPVHFYISNGAVTIVGTVRTADESQRILARVQQTPGVLSTFNDLHVASPYAPVQPQTTGALGQTVTDHAFSASDRSLLTTVQQEAALQLGVTGASGTQMPVHFSIQNGVVGVIGQVNSAQEKAALLAAIQRTPGVARVVDDVSLSAAANANAPAASMSAPSTGILAPTSRDGQTNNLMINTTNSSGF